MLSAVKLAYFTKLIVSRGLILRIFVWQRVLRPNPKGRRKIPEFTGVGEWPWSTRIGDTEEYVNEGFLRRNREFGGIGLASAYVLCP
jgi:hypothetical protein